MARQPASVDNTILVETITFNDMIYRNILLSLLIALTSVSDAFAAKAKPGIEVLGQSDGTTITVLVHGDEHFHY